MLTDDLGDLLAVIARTLDERVAPELSDPYLREQLVAIARLLDTLAAAWPRILEDGSWSQALAQQVLSVSEATRSVDGGAAPIPALESVAWSAVKSLIAASGDDAAEARRKIRGQMKAAYADLAATFSPPGTFVVDATK
ncbi:MAG TPA: hypothetical protein VHW74_10720 [Mycobacteriales bacterium]|nr:hypothetical protein [Mycobacteriales bacterium]